MRDLIGWRDEIVKDDGLPAIRPQVLSRDSWTPDYDGIWRWRIKTLKALRKDPKAVRSAKTYYETRPREFILDWMDTYDPRRADHKWIPFVLFQRQSELIDFFRSLDTDQESGLVEKCRDMGATWLACAYSVWCFLFLKDDATGWGSRKEDLVDTIGDPDSIFEKIRLLIRRLPKEFIPDEFNWKRHSSFLKIVNPENGSIIAGEAGDNIGRGGRKTRYFLDEAAHIERAEKVEAALGDNTNVRIDISSVNGLGNVFHRRREHGITWIPNAIIGKGYVRVFVMDWRDNPFKTQEWYDNRRSKYEREGMLHIFAQEVDRSYSAAISNTLIPYEHIRAAIDAHFKIPYLVGKAEGGWSAGLDVADGGVDRNAMTTVQGIIARMADEWGERDAGETARRAVERCLPYRGQIECQYDSIGIGSTVKAEYNRLITDNVITFNDVPFIPWNAGDAVQRPYDRIIPDDPQSALNRDFFENMKAQAWDNVRVRFYKTFKAVTEGAIYHPNELISIDSRIPLLEQLCKELAQARRGRSSRLKMLIEKTPDGTRSPNLADSFIMAYNPLPRNASQVQVGGYGIN